MASPPSSPSPRPTRPPPNSPPPRSNAPANAPPTRRRRTTRPRRTGRTARRAEPWSASEPSPSAACTSRRSAPESLPPAAGASRRSAARRMSVDGVRWRVRTGAPWPDLPREQGRWPPRPGPTAAPHPSDNRLPCRRRSPKVRR
ncbi:hypothetical protein CP979_30615 [Streptomyces filamentosus]|nr:hypothetical protein CP979_30615 [Streptomyces filamentosus]